jgi:type IV pilus assembly protein PilV
MVGAEAGFTLIEVLVSALIVILLSAGVAGALITTAHFSGDQRLRSQADSLATQDQERLRGLSDQQLSGLDQTRTDGLDGSDFIVNSTSTFLDTGGTSSCTSSAAAYYKIASSVSWTEGGGSPPTTIVEESLLSRPVFGDLLVQVNDQTGQWLSGIGVAVTAGAAGSGNQSGLTDGNGCVLFAGLTPGSYAVSLNAPNYVDPDGDASPPNEIATVTSTGTASPAGLPFHLGLAGSIVGTFTTSAAGAGGEADGISWLGSGASYGMSGGYRSTTSSTPAGTLTTGLLFPFDESTGTPSYTGNYTVWGGRCAQQEPPVGDDRSTVTPGSTSQAQSVQEPLLDVGSISYHSGGALTTVKPDHVRLTFTSASGTSCSDSWYPTVSSATALPATGWLADPGQPYADGTAGSLTVCADYGGYKSSVSTVNASFVSANVVPAITIVANPASAGTC